MRGSILDKDCSDLSGLKEQIKPSMWHILARISPHQIEQLQRLKKNLKEIETK